MGTKREQERRRKGYKREKVFYFVPSARLGSTQCIGAVEEVVFRDASSVVRGDEWTSSSCSPSPPEDKTFLPLGFFGLRYSSPSQTLYWVSPSLVEEGFLPKKLIS